MKRTLLTEISPRLQQQIHNPLQPHNSRAYVNAMKNLQARISELEALNLTYHQQVLSLNQQIRSHTIRQKFLLQQIEKTLKLFGKMFQINKGQAGNQASQNVDFSGTFSHQNELGLESDSILQTFAANCNKIREFQKQLIQFQSSLQLKQYDIIFYQSKINSLEKQLAEQQKLKNLSQNQLKENRHLMAQLQRDILQLNQVNLTLKLSLNSLKTYKEENNKQDAHEISRLNKQLKIKQDRLQVLQSQLSKFTIDWGNLNNSYVNKNIQEQETAHDIFDHGYSLQELISLKNSKKVDGKKSNFIFQI